MSGVASKGPGIGKSIESRSKWIEDDRHDGRRVIYVWRGHVARAAPEVAAVEADQADAIGYGGVAAVARATGLAISTVRKGRDEVRAGAKPDDVVKVRRSTGKRPFEVIHPEVWPTLERLVDPVTRGDPESPLRWTCKSTHVLADELFAKYGIKVSNKTVPNCFVTTGTACKRRTRPLRESSIPTATRSSSTSTRRRATASSGACQ